MKISLFNLHAIRSNIILLFLLISFTTCKKNNTDSLIQNVSYTRSYPMAGNQTAMFIMPSNSDGTYILGTNDAFGKSPLMLMKVSKDGKIQEQKDLLGNFVGGIPQFYTLADGSVLFSSVNGGVIGKINRNGEIVFSTSLNKMIYDSPPLLSGDNNILVVSAPGFGPGNYCQIQKISADGAFKQSLNVYHSSFAKGFKTLDMNLLKCDTFGDFYVYGRCYPNWNGSYRNNKVKLYIAHQRYSGGTLIYNNLKVFDSTNKDYDYVYTNVGIETKDNNFTMLSTRLNYNNIPSGLMFKLDKDLNILWERTITVGAEGNGYTSLSETPQGNLIASGWLGLPVAWSGSPFAFYADADGKIIWQKSYPTPVIAALNYGYRNTDGSFMFCGYTPSFGKGINDDDVLLIKTDKDGNIK